MAWTRGAEARRSRAVMTGPRDHEMDSQIPYVQPIPHVVRHRRPVALPAGMHRLMPVSQRTLRRGNVQVCMCLPTDDKTSAHHERVKEHSISNRLPWGALAHINMRFRQRNIPEAGEMDRGNGVDAAQYCVVVSPEVRIWRFAALVRTSNLERRSEFQE